jgi:predicted nucleic acid-binding protein
MNVFLDANILVSVLNREYPLYEYSARVLSLAGSSRYKLYTSPLCLAIACYFSEKKSGPTLAKRKVSVLSQKINIAAMDEEIVRKAATNKTIHDFEDGLEYYAAQKAKCRYIVTEDVRDYFFSEIEVLTAEQFLKSKVL